MYFPEYLSWNKCKQSIHAHPPTSSGGGDVDPGGDTHSKPFIPSNTGVQSKQRIQNLSGIRWNSSEKSLECSHVSSSLLPRMRKGNLSINPVTDVCWSCLFPIQIGGGNVTPQHKDFVKYKIKRLCQKYLIPRAFWKPTRLIDVTRIPSKLMGLCNISIGKPGLNQGGVKSTTPEIESSSFYHLHYYQFPIWSLLDLGIDFVYEHLIPLNVS